MDFELLALDLTAAANQSLDALIVLVPDDFHPSSDPVSNLIGQADQSGDFLKKAGQTLNIYQPAGVEARRLVLARIATGVAKNVQQAVSASVGQVKDQAQELAIVCAGGLRAQTLRVAMLAAAEASYIYTTTKSKPEPRKLKKIIMGVDFIDIKDESIQNAFAQGCALVDGVELAKEWANRPANHATPTKLAEAAQALCQLPNIKVDVLGPKHIEALGMGAFLSVAKGSSEPLRFIELRYEGAKKSKQPPVVLIGKGITFDTGGISLKPAAEMDEMKFDMSGAASVLGVFASLGQLKPAINVVGLIPACENMPGPQATKPGDVVTSMSGQTIEILNTDAEGRLILCDALTYAERFKPQAVIDVATLTGACVIALGAQRSGLFCNDEQLAGALAAAGERTLDLCWRMPLDDEYAESLKSNFADLANVGGRAAGSVTAAKFLQKFVGDFPWAHLDIAGSAWKSGAQKGATGRPVVLLVEYLLGLTDQTTLTSKLNKSTKKASKNKIS